MELISPQIAVIESQMPSGLNAGTLNTSWNTVPLNTLIFKDSSIDCSLNFSLHQFTLGEGVYHIKASSPYLYFRNEDLFGFATRLALYCPVEQYYLLGVGSNIDSISQSNFPINQKILNCVFDFEITRTYTFELQIWSPKERIDDGLGIALEFDEKNVYSRVVIMREGEYISPVEYEDTYNIATFTDVKPVGTPGGTFLSGEWRQRELNYTIQNDIIDCSLLNNEIIVPIGKYIVEASAPAVNIEGHTIRLVNVDTNSVLAEGSTKISSFAEDDNTQSIMFGYFETSQQTTIALEHFGNVSQTDIGFGREMIGSLASTFSKIKLTQIAKEKI